MDKLVKVSEEPPSDLHRLSNAVLLAPDLASADLGEIDPAHKRGIAPTL
jgi:hypothetical protein